MSERYLHDIGQATICLHHVSYVERRDGLYVITMADGMRFERRAADLPPDTRAALDGEEVADF